MNIDGNNTQKPFDQDLNTYDNVNFTRVDVSGAILDNSQLATKLYVDAHSGGGGGNLSYVGPATATNYIYKSSTSDGKSAVKSNIVDTGATVTVITTLQCLALDGQAMGGNLNIGNNQATVTILADCIADKFVKTGGTAIQYLMGDGSTLTQSATSGNSNFYLYQNKDGVTTPPPAGGDLGYNNSVQASATKVYISHLTQDVIDVEVFFKQINQLSDLYIQDKENSTNWIKYNITALPTLNIGSYLEVPVIMSSYGGTGATSFGSNHRLLVAFFSNLTEVDQRLSTLETKTQNQTATALTTTFAPGTTVVCETINPNVIKCSEINTLALNGSMTFGNQSGDMFLGRATKNMTIYNDLLTTNGINSTTIYAPNAYADNIWVDKVDTNTVYPLNIGTVNAGLITLGRTGQNVYCPSTFNGVAIGLSGGNGTMYLRGSGIPYYRNTCISPFGAPLEQTGVSSFAGSNYSVQSFLMPESLDISSLIMNRSVVTSLTISVAIYNSNRTQIFTSTLTATTATTLTFPAGFGMTGGSYYYFAVYAPNTSGFYSGTKAGGTIVNSGLNASLQYSSFNVASTTLPATLPTTGILIGSIIQPPFTLIGY